MVMTTMSAVIVKISKNDTNLKNINETIQLDTKDWSHYIKSIRNVQKNVNTYLTELVEQEKCAGDTEQVTAKEEEDEESDDDDEDEENDSIKRKLANVDNKKSTKKAKLKI